MAGIKGVYPTFIRISTIHYHIVSLLVVDELPYQIKAFEN